MFRRSVRRAEGVMDFVDTSYLRNKRPPVPGGAWPRDLLRLKSIADLQQLWFVLLKERSMLRSMKEHYLVHTEELGAMPAPSRLTMVEESMGNLKAVMRERDNDATDRATAIFRERLAKGTYRYPPGPPLPPGKSTSHSTVRLSLAGYVDPDRVRELLGRYDVFEQHKGIAKVEVRLAEEAVAQKKEAEDAFEAWRIATDDAAQYNRYNNGGSYFDSSVDVELAPGEFLDAGVVAAELPVPERQTHRAPSADPLERLRHEDRPYINRQVLQYGYFPNFAEEAPADPGPRPTHPDEIEGPWEAVVTYEAADGAAYVEGLELKSIDGAAVLAVEDVTERLPEAASNPVYQEALREAAAEEEHAKTWPNVPTWKKAWGKTLQQPLEKIIQHNYSNVADYVDREALLTGKSVWERPIDIDPSCGQQVNVPPHAAPPSTLLHKPRYVAGSTQ